MTIPIMKKAIVLIVAPLILVSKVACETKDNSFIPTARYTTVAITPTAAQTDLFAVIVNPHFPQTIYTVGQALTVLLQRSGYRLAVPEHSDPAQFILYRLTLPEAHRKLGPMTLGTALSLLGTPSFTLVVNPVRRTIGYTLHEDYQHYVNDNDIATAKALWLKQSVPTNIQPTQYGPVQTGETLSAIALSLTLSGVDHYQIMIGLYHANPTAFIHQNIHQLMAGSTLTIPDISMAKTVSSVSAQQTILKQWDALETSRRQP